MLLRNRVSRESLQANSLFCNKKSPNLLFFTPQTGMVKNVVTGIFKRATSVL
jgi:hypothetical protein